VGVAGGVDAIILLGELGRPADAALAADEAREHPAVPPEGRHGRLGGSLGADSHLRLDQFPEFEEFHIIVGGFLGGQRSGDPLAGGQGGDVFRDPEGEGVATLAETGDEENISGVRPGEGLGQHQEGVGGPRLAADLVHGADDLGRRRPQGLGDVPVLRRKEAGEGQFRHVLHSDPELFQKPLDGLGDELGVTLLPKPALLPHIVVTAVGAPIMIDEIVGDGKGAEILGDDLFVPDEEGRRPIAEPHLVEIGGFRFPLVRGRDQDLATAARPDGVEGGDETRGSRPERRGEIGGEDVVPEIQGGGHDSGVLAVGEGKGGRAEIGGLHGLFVHADEAVPGRRHRHGEAVLVEVAHGALPLGDHDQGRGEPPHGLIDGHPVQAEARDIGAVSGNSNHCSLLHFNLKNENRPHFYLSLKSFSISCDLRRSPPILIFPAV